MEEPPSSLCPLTRGEVVYVPGAFTPLGQTIIRDRVEPALRIELAPEDACQFAANTVCLGNTLVMSGCSAHLRAELQERGYRLVTQRGLRLLPDTAARSQFQPGRSSTDGGCLSAPGGSD
jgi:N-dimethylarginine dimethylaminohydrolase